MLIVALQEKVLGLLRRSEGASDAFAIHYNSRHTRLESDAGVLADEGMVEAFPSDRPEHSFRKQFCQGETVLRFAAGLRVNETLIRSFRLH